MEMIGIETILPLLLSRNWSLIKTTNESGQFITTDRPIILLWENPEKQPPFIKNNPGYGMSNTQLYFPLSQDLALSGEFDGKEGLI